MVLLIEGHQFLGLLGAIKAHFEGVFLRAPYWEPMTRKCHALVVDVWWGLQVFAYIYIYVYIYIYRLGCSAAGAKRAVAKPPGQCVVYCEGLRQQSHHAQFTYNRASSTWKPYADSGCTRFPKIICGWLLRYDFSRMLASNSPTVQVYASAPQLRSLKWSRFKV